MLEYDLDRYISLVFRYGKLLESNFLGHAFGEGIWKTFYDLLIKMLQFFSLLW